MGETTKIEWCDHTFNPWRGCTKVSAGCANCYAERQSRRVPQVLGIWGDDGTRVIASEAGWKEPVKWNRAAAKAGVRRRVFCGSMCDICEDRHELIEPRIQLKRLIEATPHLDWLLLSKRPEQYSRLFYGPECWPRNVWVGTSVENQATADERIPHLLAVDARVRFLSCEPLLWPVDLRRWLPDTADDRDGCLIDWVIIGGESGPKHRPCEIEWIADIVSQCRAAGVAVFVKQDCGPRSGMQGRILDDIWIKEFPK